MKKLQLLFVLTLLVYTNNLLAQAGCTDPLAQNHDNQAITNDGSCTYETTAYTLSQMAIMAPELEETSGLAMIGSNVWSHGDSGNPAILYQIDSLTGNIMHEVTISNASNVDWEDMAEDENYVYIGETGNNAGNRTDLRIYRIAKSDLTQSTATADLITYTYSDQTDFIADYKNHDFDCEALIHHNDSLHIFTKNWVNNQTRHYTFPATPGNYVIEPRASFDVEGLVTAADISDDGVIALLGYTSGGATFMWLLFDYEGTQFFSGNKRKISLGSAINTSQAEGIVFKEGGYGYISGESVSILPARLFAFETEQWTNPMISNTNQLHKLELKIYPNPFEDNITIQTNEPLNGKVQINLFNTLGQLVFTKEREYYGDTNLSIQLDNTLPFGTYHLQLSNEQSIGYFKVIKQ